MPATISTTASTTRAQGPLITQFVPAPGCLSFKQVNTSENVFRLADGEGPTRASCYPSAVLDNCPATGTESSNQRWLSPARCPSAYRPFTVTSRVGYSTLSAEKVYQCCPSLLTPYKDGQQGCQIRTPVSLSTQRPTAWSQTAVTYSRDADPNTAYACAIQVRFQATDVPILSFNSSESYAYALDAGVASPTGALTIESPISYKYRKKLSRTGLILSCVFGGLVGLTILTCIFCAILISRDDKKKEKERKREEQWKRKTDEESAAWRAEEARRKEALIEEERRVEQRNAELARKERSFEVDQIQKKIAEDNRNNEFDNKRREQVRFLASSERNPVDILRRQAKNYITGDFSDATVVCGSRTFQVHRSIVATSQYFARMFQSSFREGRDARVVIGEEHETLIMEKLFSYIYRDNYHDGTETEDWSDWNFGTSDATSPVQTRGIFIHRNNSVPENGPALLINAKLYIEADYFQLPGLKNLAAKKLEPRLRSSFRTPEMFDLITLTYSYTSKEDRELRNLVLKTIHEHKAYFLDKERFNNCMEELAELGLEYFGEKWKESIDLT